MTGLRWFHVGIGFFALAIFWVPALARKGGRLHVVAGRLFAITMGLVSVSALILSVALFTRPDSRTSGIFLGYLSILSAASTWAGVQAARSPSRMVASAVALQALTAISGLSIAVFGILHGNVVFIALGGVGAAIGGAAVKSGWRRPAGPNPWWRAHIAGMIGSGIAAYTAFLVFGGSRLVPALASGRWYWVFWLLPTAVGIPAIVLSIRRYSRVYRRPVGE